MLTLKVGSPDRAATALPDGHVVAYDSAGAAVAYGARSNGDVLLTVPDVATFRLQPGSGVVTARADEAAAPEAVLDAYYGTALPLVVQATRGLQVLHGSAVLADPPRVVALCGVSGAGKSTLARELAARGYGHWADDAVAFRTNGRHGATSVGLPFLARRSGSPSDVADAFARKRARLAAIFLLEPRPAPAERAESVQVERLAAADALGALLPNAFRFQPEEREHRRDTLLAYLDVAASVPVFRVRFVRGLRRLPRLLDELERAIAELA